MPTQQSNLDALSAVERVFTTPMVLATLLGGTGLTVGVHLDRTRASLWHFRFARRSVLSVDADGSWSWLRCPDHLRRQVEPLLAQAEDVVRQSHAWRRLLRDEGDVIAGWLTAGEVDVAEADDRNLGQGTALTTAAFKARLEPEGQG